MVSPGLPRVRSPAPEGLPGALGRAGAAHGVVDPHLRVLQPLGVEPAWVAVRRARNTALRALARDVANRLTVVRHLSIVKPQTEGATRAP